jgi:hypothetical protein
MLYRALIKVENSIFHGNENNAHLLEIMIKHIYIYIWVEKNQIQPQIQDGGNKRYLIL